MAAIRLSDFDVSTAIAQLPHCDPRLALIQVAVKDILQAKLGLVIDEMNEQFDLAMEKPTRFEIAPTNIDDEYIDSVLVSANIATESLAPREFVNFSDISIYVIGPRIRDTAQIEELWNRAAAVRAVMYQFLNGYFDENDRRLWGQMLIKPYMALPQQWADYSGIAVTFRGRHDPGHNAWT